MWLLALIGAVSLLGQVVLLRELNVAFFGSELIYLLGMGLWLFGAAAGAVLGRSRLQPAPGRLSGLLLAGGVFLPLLLVFTRGARRLPGGVPGAYLPFFTQLFVMTLTVVPFAVVCGLLFRWAALRVMARGRSLAAAYAADCGGALVGGAAGTLLLAAGMSNLAACLLCAVLATAGALAAAPSPNSRVLRATSVAVFLTLVATLMVGPRLDRALTAWNHPHLLATRDTPYGRLTASGHAGQVALFVNDALAFENEGTVAEDFVHLSALQCPSPRRILILGGGWEDLPARAAVYRPERLIHVEINRALLEMKRATRPATHPQAGVSDGRPIAGGILDEVVADPRRYLETADGFDLILVGMPEPQSGLDNRYYTQEFFQACRDALTLDGVLAFRLRGAENLWTPALTRRNAGVYRALASVFPDLAVLPGGSNIFLASRSTLPSAATVAERLAEHLDAGDFVTRRVSPAYIHYLYTNDRFDEIRKRLATSIEPMNTDTHPACFRHTLVLWLARFFPSLGWMEAPTAGLGEVWRQPWLWVSAAGWLLAVFTVRRKPVARRSLAMAGAAAAGMVLEMVLILNYQVRVGALFKDLGLLLTLFMLGLTAGAVGMAAALNRETCGPKHEVRSRLLATAPWGALVAAAVVTAIFIDQGWAASLFVVGLLLVGTGAAVAAIFARLGRVDKAIVSSNDGEAAGRLVAPLYAADLIGGGLGSLATGLFLIPVWGLTGSALAAIVVALMAVLPLVSGPQKTGG